MASVDVVKIGTGGFKYICAQRQFPRIASHTILSITSIHEGGRRAYPDQGIGQDMLP